MLSILLEYVDYSSLLTEALGTYAQMVYNAVSISLSLLSKTVVFMVLFLPRYSVFIN